MSMRIVFVAPYAWAAISGEGDYVGGAEMQQARLARTLAGRGHDVWLVVADFGQAAHVVIDGVHVERAYAPYAGVPGLRFFHPRWSGVVRALDRVRPDIVYQRTAGALTGQCALWASAHGRRFVFAAAHDFDPLPRSPHLTNARERWLVRWGIRHADVVLAQSANQAEAFARHHGITATVVPNVVDVPPAPRPEDAAERVTWIGTVKAAKRPEWLVAAARALPDMRFTLAGGPPPPATDADYRRIVADAQGLANLELAGFVSPRDVPALFDRTALLAHTSPAEGFPNTLLEAWARGVPSVSVVDPDGAVSAGGAGVLVRNADEFASAIRDLMYDPARRRALGSAARRHVLEHHAPEAVALAFEAALGLAPAARATQSA